MQTDVIKHFKVCRKESKYCKWRSGGPWPQAPDSGRLVRFSRAYHGSDTQGGERQGVKTCGIDIEQDR